MIKIMIVLLCYFQRGTKQQQQPEKVFILASVSVPAPTPSPFPNYPVWHSVMNYTRSHSLVKLCAGIHVQCEVMGTQNKNVQKKKIIL